MKLSDINPFKKDQEETPDLNTIKKECSVYLNRIKNKEITPLYRGVQQRFDIKKVAVDKARKPRNSSKIRHTILNALILKQTGVQNLRNEAVFCINDIEEATPYGMAYYFIPTNDFQVIYSPGTHDSINVQPNIGQYILSGMSEEEAFQRYVNEERDSRHGRALDYRALNRIMKDTFDRTLKYFKNLVKKDVSTFETSNEATEFMFYGSDYYYLVNPIKYNMSELL